MINLASILELSLEGRGSQRTQDFAPKLLNLFTIQSRVELQRGRTSVFIGKSRKNRGPSDSVKTNGQLRSRD